MESILVKKNFLNISPQKINLIASLLRKKNLSNSLFFLSNKNGLLKKGGKIIYGIIKGISNKILKEKKIIDEKRLELLNEYFIDKLFINKSIIRKSVFYRAKGRSDVRRKRYSSLEIIVSKK